METAIYSRKIIGHKKAPEIQKVNTPIIISNSENSGNTKFILGFLIAFIIFGGIMAYEIHIGAFKSNINQDVALNPDFNATVQLSAPITNNVNPSITLNPNITIVISNLRVIGGNSS